jgi:hypothetical protein
MYSGLHIKYSLFLSDLNNLDVFRQILEKSLNVKFHENPSCDSRVVPCNQTEGRTDRQADITKQIVPFRNFANALDKGDK